jgi:hypothetical protein
LQYLAGGERLVDYAHTSASYMVGSVIGLRSGGREGI